MSSRDNKFKLVWDNWNIEHIKKHGVTVLEVREACKNRIAVKQSYLGRQMILGVTKNKRLLTVSLSFEKQKEGYVVSARDMSSKERKIYNEKTKTN